MIESVQKAGAIILSKIDKNKVALLYRGKQGDWSFPKGHIESGENANEATIREIQEETGLAVRVIRTLPDNVYFSPREGSISMKMFVVQSENDSLVKIENNSDDIQWIDYADVEHKLSYDNLKSYFKSILPIIKEVIVSE